MKLKTFFRGRWVAFLKCLLASYLLTGMLLLLLALGLYKLQLSEQVVRIGIIIIYILSAFLAGFLVAKVQDKRKFLWGALLGVLYFFVLLLISLITNRLVQDMTFSAFTILLICGGSGMLGGMLG